MYSIIYCWNDGVEPFSLINNHYQQIREELEYNNVRLYPFDTDDDEQDEIELNQTIRVSFVQ